MWLAGRRASTAGLHRECENEAARAAVAQAHGLRWRLTLNHLAVLGVFSALHPREKVVLTRSCAVLHFFFLLPVGKGLMNIVFGRHPEQIPESRDESAGVITSKIIDPRWHDLVFEKP